MPLWRGPVSVIEGNWPVNLRRRGVRSRSIMTCPAWPTDQDKSISNLQSSWILAVQGCVPSPASGGVRGDAGERWNCGDDREGGCMVRAKRVWSRLPGWSGICRSGREMRSTGWPVFSSWLTSFLSLPAPLPPLRTPPSLSPAERAAAASCDGLVMHAIRYPAGLSRRPCVSAHSCMAVSTGSRLWPRGVSEYSTLGGTC